MCGSIAAACRAAGTTIGDVRAAILETKVALAMQLDPSSIDTKNIRVRLHGGVAVTMMENGRDMPRGRMKVMTWREMEVTSNKRLRKAMGHHKPKNRAFEGGE